LLPGPRLRGRRVRPQPGVSWRQARSGLPAEMPHRQPVPDGILMISARRLLAASILGYSLAASSGCGGPHSAAAVPMAAPDQVTAPKPAPPARASAAPAAEAAPGGTSVVTAAPPASESLASAAEVTVARPQAVTPESTSIS